MTRSSVQPSVRRAKTISAFSELRTTEMRIAQMCVETQIEGGEETVPIRNNNTSEHRRTLQYSSSKHSILRKSHITCVDKNESLNMMRKACTPPKPMSQSCCARNCPAILASISLEPLVSESFCELELSRISKDLLLRHDLNFDRNITYRPNTHGVRGQQRTVQSVEYWNAIRKELVLLLTNDDTNPSIEASHNTGSSTQACSSCTPGFPRLSRMFGAVRRILKSLIHEDEWDAIDARLDVDMLVQQLRNRAFDLVALSDWLAVLLRRFCSPKRYQSIDVMTSSIRLGVERVEAQPIATGLISMFDILETIKLDAANYEIRCFYSVMLDGTVAFEQSDILNRIENGWDPSEARTWLASERQSRSLQSGASTIVPAVTSMIVYDDDYLPPTFSLDYTRLRSLQTQFQNLMYRLACLRTFEAVLKMLGCNAPTPESFNNDLFARISTLTSDRPNLSEQGADIALEVVSRAYKVCKIPNLPSSTDLEFAERHLQQNYERTNDNFSDLERLLADKLLHFTEQEISIIGNFSPVQIVNHYQPESSSKSSLKPVTLESELLSIAQKIAHITILHWRVWAPLIYDEPVGKKFQDSNPASAAPASVGDVQVQCSRDHEEYSRQNCRRDCAWEMGGGHR